jgi:hypothetical protein
MAFCALAKPTAPPERAEALEAEYMRLVGTVGPETTRRFSEMLGEMALDVSETGRDFLSAIAGDDDVRALNSGAGQFFTPYDVCRMMAAMTVGDVKAQLGEKGYLTVCEPASGAGGMLLAVVETMKQQDIDVTHDVWFDATDISALCFQMTFIQMTLVGCSGVVRRADTLRGPQDGDDAAMTPQTWRFFGRHGWPDERAPRPPAEEPALVAAASGELVQAALF